MPETLANNATSTTRVGISNIDVSLPIQTADVAKFPASGNYRVSVSDGTNTELMLVTGGQGTNALTVVRAIEPIGGVQTAFPFVNGSTVAQVLTSAGLSSMLVPAGAGGGGMVPIQTQTPVGNAACTLTVPPGFRNLRLVGTGRTTATGTEVSVTLQLNGDTGARYFGQQISASSTTPSAADQQALTALPVGRFPAGSSTAGAASMIVIDLADVSNAVLHKVLNSRVSHTLAETATGRRVESYAGLWASTAPITSITIALSGAGNFDTGTVWQLWGESDAAPLLLATNSNLLFDTTLQAAQATIPIPVIYQGFRDLRIEIDARGDTAATSADLTLQINGDTGANYDFFAGFQNLTGIGGVQGQASTAARVGQIVSASAPAAVSSGITLLLRNYAGSQFNKEITSYGNVKTSTATNNQSFTASGAFWRSSAPITSLLFGLSAGNFVAGTTVRVYGEPASAAPAAVGTGLRVRTSGAQPVSNGFVRMIAWDVELQDPDNQHQSLTTQFTGTVAVTSGSPNLVGTGTLWTTEVSVGQSIAINTGVYVVTAIADNTHLTISPVWSGGTTSGQVMARDNTAIVFRRPGMYTVEASLAWDMSGLAAGTTGYANVQIINTAGQSVGEGIVPVIPGQTVVTQVSVQYPFQQWDFVTIMAGHQNSAGSVLNVTTTQELTHLSVQARPTIIIGTPYVLLQDQKASGSAGGTFTQGAWQNRDLNTIVRDDTGQVSVSSNQFALPPGTYRYQIKAPAYGVQNHQARLQNITDAATVAYGTSEWIASPDGGISSSVISGKLTITASKTFQVQHQCAATRASAGFGVGNSFGNVQIFTQVELWKEG